METLTKVIVTICVVVVVWLLRGLFSFPCRRDPFDPAVLKALSKQDHESLIKFWSECDTELQRGIADRIYGWTRNRACAEFFNYLSERYPKAQPLEKANIIAVFRELGMHNRAVQRQTIIFLSELVEQRDEHLLSAIAALGGKVFSMCLDFHVPRKKQELVVCAVDALLNVLNGEYDSDAKVKAQGSITYGTCVAGYKRKLEDSLRRLYTATNDQHLKCCTLASLAYVSDKGDQFLCDGIRATIEVFDQLAEEEAYWLMLTIRFGGTPDFLPFLDIAKHYFPDSERYQFQVRRNRERLSDERDKEHTSS